MKDESKYFKVMSLLLQYPDEGYFEALPALKSVVAEMNLGRLRASIEAFLTDLEACSVLQVQQRYTALFDMNPSTTLNITYHLWGDGEKRARLLTLLQQEYACADLEKDSSELPDYLPLILEFMAAAPQAKSADAIQKSWEAIDTLVERLKPIAASYAELLAPLAGIFKEQAEQRTDAALR